MIPPEEFQEFFNIILTDKNETRVNLEKWISIIDFKLYLCYILLRYY